MKIRFRPFLILSISILLLILAILISQTTSTVLVQPTPVYPTSTVIASIQWDLSSKRTLAPGSDNWAITWAADGHQYTTWGDGGGFGGANRDGRSSLGFARIEGGKNDYVGVNLWGGINAKNTAKFRGKSYGIIAIDGVLYMWRGHQDAPGENVYGTSTLYRSTDASASWDETSVSYNAGFFTPTFLQFGRDYSGARDQYVYTYAPEQKTTDWEVNKPGELMLARVDKSRITDISAYEFFTGVNSRNQPSWTSDIDARKPVFNDPVNGIMRTSVSYNPGLERYFLATQQVSLLRDDDFHIGIYDSPTPWGPWTTVEFANAEELGLISANYWKTVFFNFSNKWLSNDGKSFVMVYTDEDNWASVEGEFVLADTSDPSPPAGTVTE
jgi:hypothetical protein